MGARAGEAQVPEGMVPALYRWIVEDDEVLGAVSLRLRLNDFLREVGGHIGYCVRPSARRRGLAAFALGAALADVRGTELGRSRRYWIATG